MVSLGTPRLQHKAGRQLAEQPGVSFRPPCARQQRPPSARRRSLLVAAAAGHSGGSSDGGGGSPGPGGGGHGPFEHGQRGAERNLLNAISSAERAGAEYGEVRTRQNSALCRPAVHHLAAAAARRLTPAPSCPSLPCPSPFFLPLPQGFIQFRLSGEHINLDVDKLNEQMQIQGAQRIR